MYVDIIIIEVAQQSRIRHKEDFIIAFSPVIAEATALAYKGAPLELQGKLKRVIDVWKERSIFEPPIQAAITGRIEGMQMRGRTSLDCSELTSFTEIDKARGGSNTTFGSSPFGSNSIPAEFSKLIALQKKTQGLASPLSTTVAGAKREYEKQTDASIPVPSAPVYAARLNGLLKSLASAEHAVAECVKARRDLIAELDSMLSEERSALQKDETVIDELSKQSREIETRKEQVESAIMRAMDPSGEQNPDGMEATPREPDRPEVEALTPPSAEPLSPVGEPQLVFVKHEEDQKARALPITSNGSNKRRRVAEDNGDFPDLGSENELDADVADILQQS